MRQTQDSPSCLFVSAVAAVIAIYTAIMHNVFVHFNILPDTPEAFAALTLAPPALILSTFVLILSFCPHGPLV